MTSGQELALEQVAAVEAEADGALEVLSFNQPGRSGWVTAELSLDCHGFDHHPEGLPLRERERILVLIPPHFPFAPPSTWTPHSRFAGKPHVQWNRSLCLYLSPEVEWSPADGMFGFLTRLEEWLRAGARGEWEREGAPLHPPVAYETSGTPLVIPRVNTPTVAEGPWLGFARCDPASAARMDIVGWQEFGVVPEGFAIPAVLLSTPFPFEYPAKLGGLFNELEKAGVDRDTILLLLKVSVLFNGPEAPIYVALGTPMRGTEGGDTAQHLAVWRVSSEHSQTVAKTIHRDSDTDELAGIRTELADALMKLLEVSDTEWCPVREARPEVTRRRDFEAPMSWFRGRHVAVWGCGALGGHIAIALTRAGVQRLTLHDNGAVAPGLLERQPFEDADLGSLKVEALKRHLLRINPQLGVDIHSTDLIRGRLESSDWTDDADIVIDATANRLVRARLENIRWKEPHVRCPLVSMMIDGDAGCGLLTVSPIGYSGGPADLIRKAKIRLGREPNGGGFRRAFWPDGSPHLFLPEPGCSSPTFVGSAADVTWLASALLNGAAGELARQTNEGVVHLITSPTRSASDPDRMISRVWRWVPEQRVRDIVSGYEVRIASGAWRSLLGWVKEGARSQGPHVETGGVLFGLRNDASRVVWVDDVVGPPPDSIRSAQEFVCGASGVQEVHEAKAAESSGSVEFVGMWHTHPSSPAIPSSRDIDGMARIVMSTEPTPRKALLMILGGPDSPSSRMEVGCYLFDRSAFNRTAVKIRAVPVSVDGPPERCQARTFGLALSGGGSRAMAFHLGCLRALDDLGILSQVRVISAVSGGSVIGAMYAYVDDDFAGFEQRVHQTLRGGLQGKIAREWLRPTSLARSAAVTIGPGLAAVASAAFRRGTTWAGRTLGMRRLPVQGAARQARPPWRRRWSRTTAFEAALSRHLFPELVLTSPRRDGLDIVLNATELRTLSAFRFGSKESGSWRFGRLADNSEVPLAHAVACSAAYPALLPAMDEVYELSGLDGPVRERVILTDGGVYDNLGVTCLEPGRRAEVSVNTIPVSHIIACDAGHGLPAGGSFPFWWPSRMMRAVKSSLRQVQRGAQDRLHRHAAIGRLDGFIYAYLGQRDSRLPYLPGDWIPRSAVKDYPTDFAPMSAEAIDLLSGRGERLVRLLVDHYSAGL